MKSSLLRCMVCGLALAANVQGTPVTSGLLLHLDASDIDGDGIAEGLGEDGLVGNRITTWVDLSVNGNNVTDAANTTRRPALELNAINGRPVVDMAGNAYLSRLDSLGLSGNPGLTVFAVMRDNDGAQGDHRIIQLGQADGASSGGRVIGLSNDSSWRYNNGNHVFANDPIGMSDTIAVWRTAAGQTYADTEYFQNGPLPAIATSTGNGTGTVNIPDESTVIGGGFFTGGTLTNASNNSNADIAEVLIYDRALTDTELNLVGNYLQDRWMINANFIPEPGTGSLLVLGWAVLHVSRRLTRRGEV